MAGTVSNTNKVPVWVCFNDVNLGICNAGDVTVKVSSVWAETLTHQSGNYLVNAHFNGASATVTCNFAETEEPDTWLAAFGFGDKQTYSESERFAFNTIDAVASQWDIGTRATGIDHMLVLIPTASYAAADTEGDDDIVIQSAFCRNVGDIIFSSETNQGLECTFEALLATDVAGANLMIRGTQTGVWSES